MNLFSEDEFIETLAKKTKLQDVALVKKAYEFAKTAHQGQKRDSGDEYFVHPLDVAIILADFKMDDKSIIAALLHDVVEDTEISLPTILKEFGSEIAFLVDGLTKIENAKFESRTEKNAENFRKLIMSTSKDIRVLIIKLCDRLSNARSLKGISDESRRDRIANETLMVYAPLAERIGFYKLKNELEDISFDELHHAENVDIIKKIKKVKHNNKSIIDEIIKIFKVKVEFENKIKSTIIGREKRPYSIWKKMQRKGTFFERIFDIIAFRIIVNKVEDCYRVLGLINSTYIMVPDTFKDYISKPKDNGYQSLHTVVIGPKNVKIEVQIRTADMNRVAEYGLASHWMYKQNIKSDKHLEQYNYIKDLIEKIENSDYDLDMFSSIQHEMIEDEIFCYTPKGDIINLPIGSTGVDFAYAIHKDVGNRCSGVKINGALVQLKTPLSSGDEVEIITSKNIQANEEWLDFVKTSKARNNIRSYVRSLHQDEFERIGRELVSIYFKNLNLSISDDLIEKNLSKFGSIKDVTNFYVLVSEGKIKEKEILKVLYPDYEKSKTSIQEVEKNIIAKIKVNSGKIKKDNDEIGIFGLDKNTVYKYAKCCYPIPPDEIVGVVNTGTGITVHKKSCSFLKNLSDVEGRILELQWDNNKNINYVAKVDITLDSKPGVMAKIFNLCAEKGINIIGINTHNESEFFQDLELKVEIKSAEELSNFKGSLRGLVGVIRVE